MKKLKTLVTAFAVAAALFVPNFAEAKKAKKHGNKTHISKSHKASKSKKAKKVTKVMKSGKQKRQVASEKVSLKRKKTRGYASASEYLNKGKKSHGKNKKNKKSRHSSY